MIKKFVLLVFLFSSVSAFLEKPAITAKSAILMNPFTKRVLCSIEPYRRLPPASTVKIMTSLLACKKSYPERKVVVSNHASSMEPSKIYIKKGEIYSTQDLIKAMLLSSGNDVSVALAESIAGREPDFVRMMNNTARALSAKDTNFKNASGLPAEGQFTTAYDLALIVREAMKYKVIVDTMKMKKAKIEELTTGRKIYLKNHNKSLWKQRSYLLLGKTGYTKNAGHCFAGFYQYNKWHKVIVVILGSRNLWRDLEILAQEIQNINPLCD